MTADTFRIHQSTVSKVILEICIPVKKYLCSKYLHLPKTVEEMKQKVSQFVVKFGMPQPLDVI